MGRWKRFEEMDVWKRGCKLVCDVYRASREGDLAKDFALRDQLRRSAISVPSNIAEGYERDSEGAFANMLSIAKGSVGELRTQLYIAAKLGYIDSQERKALVKEAEAISRMLASLIKRIRSK